jgi:hypothetical protein
LKDLSIEDVETPSVTRRIPDATGDGQPKVSPATNVLFETALGIGLLWKLSSGAAAKGPSSLPVVVDSDGVFLDWAQHHLPAVFHLDTSTLRSSTATQFSKEEFCSYCIETVKSALQEQMTVLLQIKEESPQGIILHPALYEGRGKLVLLLSPSKGHSPSSLEILGGQCPDWLDVKKHQIFFASRRQLSGNELLAITGRYLLQTVDPDTSAKLRQIRRSYVALSDRIEKCGEEWCRAKEKSSIAVLSERRRQLTLLEKDLVSQMDEALMKSQSWLSLAEYVLDMWKVDCAVKSFQATGKIDPSSTTGWATLSPLTGFVNETIVPSIKYALSRSREFVLASLPASSLKRLSVFATRYPVEKVDAGLPFRDDNSPSRLSSSSVVSTATPSNNHMFVVSEGVLLGICERIALDYCTQSLVSDDTNRVVKLSPSSIVGVAQSLADQGEVAPALVEMMLSVLTSQTAILRRDSTVGGSKAAARANSNAVDGQVLKVEGTAKSREQAQATAQRLTQLLQGLCLLLSQTDHTTLQGQPDEGEHLDWLKRVESAKGRYAQLKAEAVDVIGLCAVEEIYVNSMSADSGLTDSDPVPEASLEDLRSSRHNLRAALESLSATVSRIDSKTIKDRHILELSLKKDAEAFNQQVEEKLFSLRKLSDPNELLSAAPSVKALEVEAQRLRGKATALQTTNFIDEPLLSILKTAVLPKKAT